MRKIHIFRADGNRNYCRRREQVLDKRLDIYGNPPMGGSIVVDMHPRLRRIANPPEYPDRKPNVVIIEEHMAQAMISDRVIEDGEFCQECLLLESVMKANNTISTNTARCILKRMNQ